MRCLYCDSEINKESFYSMFIEEDKLCLNCRKALKLNRRIIDLDGLKVECFYDYNSLFKSLILQYKECHDEALSTVFLYGLKEYIEFKYRNFKIVYMPSSMQKLELRGFNHLDLIFKDLNLTKIDGLVYKNELVQEGKNRQDRIKMIDNFVYFGQKYEKILIVDDVLTTGSSFIGAYRALRPYCTKISGLSLSTSFCKK